MRYKLIGVSWKKGKRCYVNVSTDVLDENKIKESVISLIRKQELTHASFFIIDWEERTCVEKQYE